MKQTFVEFLIENGREDFIAQHMGHKLENAMRNDISAPHTVLDLLQALKRMDPTGGKFIQYLANQYVKGNFRVEDAGRVRPALELFIKKRNALPIKDINQYKSIHDLYDAVEEAPDPVLSGKQQAKLIKQEGSEVILKQPNFLVLQLLTGEAACYYASGTKWCTSNPKTFSSYASSGPIFLIVVKDKKGAVRKFQFHYHSGQIMNEKDTPPTKADIKLLSSFPGWYEFIDLMTQRHWSQLT